MYSIYCIYMLYNIVLFFVKKKKKVNCFAATSTQALLYVVFYM